MKQLTSYSLGIVFLTLAMGSALNSIAEEGAASGGPLYRNGGHFGLAGSDTQLEGDGPDGAPSYSDPEPAPAAYIGTLYRHDDQVIGSASDQALGRGAKTAAGRP